MHRFFALLMFACVALHAADPGSDHEIAMKQAQKAAAAADRSLEKLVIELKTGNVKFNSLQARYELLSFERQNLDATIRQALAVDVDYQALVAERRELDAQSATARKAGDTETVETLNKARYKNHVAQSKRQETMLPEKTKRSRELAEELRQLLRQLVLMATGELRDHPDIASLLATRSQAEAEVVTQRDAMLKARGEVTPVQFLASLQPPVFADGHSLPPLTRYGWVQPYELKKAFADSWGYALELGGYITEKTLDRLQDPESNEAKTIALVNSDPARYRLSVICARYFPEVVPNGTWTRDPQGNLLNAQAKSYDGTEWHPGMKTVISPLAPDDLWTEMVRGRATPLAAVRQLVPISIVLNGGEYGLGVLGFAAKVWKQDPRIVRAVGDDTWFDFISRAKAREEIIIANAVRRAVPDRNLYIYYTTSGNPHRKRWPGWVNWCHDYTCMQPVSDLPSSEHYVGSFNSGWTGEQDILTLALNSAGVQIAHGQPLAYSWFWCKSQKADMRRYLGFLKCIYVMGTIGGNAGAYDLPDFEAGFKPEEPPYWLKQQVALSRVHALFSYLEDELRQGDLVPGPFRHCWSTENPAYELLPEELSDQATTKDDIRTLSLGRPVRVLARQHRTKPQCLVVAWAADGNEREVNVDIPNYGKTILLARPGGSVYRLVKGQPPQLLDTDQDYPSRSFNSMAR